MLSRPDNVETAPLAFKELSELIDLDSRQVETRRWENPLEVPAQVPIDGEPKPKRRRFAGISFESHSRRLVDRSSPDQAVNLALSSELAIMWHPRLEEVKAADLKDSLDNYLQKVGTNQNHPARAEVAQLQSIARLGSKHVFRQLGQSGFENNMACQTARGVSEQGAQRQDHKLRAALMERHARSFRDVILAALTELDGPSSKAPLLNKFEMDSLVKISLSPKSAEFLEQPLFPTTKRPQDGEVATSIGPPAISSVSTDTTRGAAFRQLGVVRRVSPTRLDDLSAGFDFQRQPPAENPRLEIDSKGFGGSGVNGLAFSPDGSLLAAAGDVVRIWELQSGACSTRCEGNGSWVAPAPPPTWRSLRTAGIGRLRQGFRESVRIYAWVICRALNKCSTVTTAMLSESLSRPRAASWPPRAAICTSICGIGGVGKNGRGTKSPNRSTILDSPGQTTD